MAVLSPIVNDTINLPDGDYNIIISSIPLIKLQNTNRASQKLAEIITVIRNEI